MNILLVTLYALEANTSVTVSNYGLITGMLAAGHQVTVFMPEISNKLSYYDDSLDLSAVKLVRVPGNDVGSRIAGSNHNAGSIKQAAINAARKAYYRLSVFDRSRLLIKPALQVGGLDTYYDAIVSTSDPKTSHLLVRALLRQGLRAGKWIQHWGDPLSGDISRTSIYPETIIRRVEKRILNDADRIVYVSPFTLEAQQARYCDLASKMAFVPLPCIPSLSAPIREKAPDAPLKIAYLGDYSSGIRNILPLYEACRETEGVMLTIAGNSDIQLEETSRIRVLPRVAQNKAQELEAEADITVSVGNLHGTQIPGKIYYAASNGKPILVLLDGEMQERQREYFDSYHRYTCCENTKESIMEQLEGLLSGGQRTYETPESLLPKNVANAVLAF